MPGLASKRALSSVKNVARFKQMRDALAKTRQKTLSRAFKKSAGLSVGARPASMRAAVVLVLLRPL